MPFGGLHPFLRIIKEETMYDSSQVLMPFGGLHPFLQELSNGGETPVRVC